ncbi:MAG: sucrase ferredoxin, partial [Acidimicrobiales bacterium]
PATEDSRGPGAGGTSENEAMASPLRVPWPPPCSDWAKSQSLDPIGSAGYYDGFLLVEQPLPWPADVSEMPELAEVAKVAYGARLRLQAVAPVGKADSSGQLRTVICYRSTRPGWAGPMARSERLVEPELLGEAVHALVEGAAPVPRARLGDTAADVLVCTHGRRDACCGARGMELLAALTGSPMFGQPGVRAWRTSHTGGHRFAPTAIALPSATLWAWADAALLSEVVDAQGPLGSSLSRYRGCASLGSAAQQAVEKAVLSEVGWPLLSSWRRAVDLGGGMVQLETELFGTWEAVVREGRRVAQPDCRSDPGLATKQSVEWVVEGLRQVVAA